MSVFRRKAGGWQAQVNIGQEIDPETLKTKYLRDSATFDTKAEAVAWEKARKRRAEDDARNFVQPSKEPLKDYLPRWLERKHREGLRPTTLGSYEQQVRLHIIPALGTVPLCDLSPATVQRMIDDMAKEGHDGPRTIAYVRSVLRRALQDAVRLGTLGMNPCDRVKPPRQSPRKVEAFDQEQLAALFAAAEGMRIQNLLPFAAFSGLRRGEAIALRWSDVDAKKGTVAVRRNAVPVKGEIVIQEPKTEAGTRVLALPAPALDALQAQRDLQLADKKAALASGRPWRNPEGWIFTTEQGGLLGPTNVARDFRRVRDRAGVPPHSFHSLRHSAVSLRIAAGIPLEIISKQIGHKRSGFTADVYGHLLPETDRAATDALDSYLTRRRDAKPQE